MIRYGLKLWSRNRNLFDEAVERFSNKEFDFIELGHYPPEPLNFEALAKLKEIPVTVHQPNDAAFHELIATDELLSIWRDTLALADFFKSPTIIIHTGKKHTAESFFENLKKIDDPMIIVENSPGRDLFNYPMFGQHLEDLKRISEKKPICLDLQKAVSAAFHQKLDYKTYIEEVLKTIKPVYFHISGCKREGPEDPIFLHGDLWDDDTDWTWIKKQLNAYAAEVRAPLVFETPKEKNTLANDIKNIEFFRSL